MRTHYSWLHGVDIRAYGLQGARSSVQTTELQTSDEDILPSPEATQRLIKARRSRFPKDYTGETIDR